MRVVSGTARGTKLFSVPGDTTRPILDRVKTALFDILRPEIHGVRFLDVFGGSGSVGIEALSQGAGHCTFIDLERKAVATIRKNLELTRLGDKAKVINADSFAFLKKASGSFDVIYVAPPQYKKMWIDVLKILDTRPALLSKSGRIIVQIDPSEYEVVISPSFVETQQRKYGATLLVFYSWQPGH